MHAPARTVCRAGRITMPRARGQMRESRMTRHLDLPDPRNGGEDGPRRAPSAERNCAPIAEVLDRHAPRRGNALEIASGTGQHACAFAARYPDLAWQPTDADADNLTTIRAWAARAQCPNLRPPRLLDAARPGWAAAWPPQDLILLVNLLHLISDTDARAVVTECARLLAPNGRVALYGPFRKDGQLVSDGDRRFDASLRAQDPEIGYKDIETVAQWVTGAGLRLVEQVAMPANNLMLIAARD